MQIRGKVWKFGDNVDTDAIIPARYINVSDGDELAKVCFADHRPDFANDISKGDIVVAGRNFGCGSSREHAPLALKTAGVGVVIAKSFARIFYRNAFNIGLPLIESEEASDGLSDGEEMIVDLSTGEIKSANEQKSFSAKPIPDFMRELVQAGGLVSYLKLKKVKEK
jgi:3-isopropylmalate/(R)-2-methylmalate dehydratase small subunit